MDDGGYNTARESFTSHVFTDRILIVDDQSFNIEALKIILKYQLGLDSSKYCTGVLSGEKALDIIREDIES